MRFTFPILTLCHGGAQRMLAELTNGLAAKGYPVKILMPYNGAVEYPLLAPIVRTPNLDLTAADYPYGDVIVSNFYTTVSSAKQASEQGKGLHVRLALCYEPPFLANNHESFPTYHMTENLLVLSRWQQQLIQLNHGVKGRIVPVGINPFFQNLKFRSQLRRALSVTAILRNEEDGYAWHREQTYLIDQLRLVKARHPGVEINFIVPPEEFAASLNLQRLKAAGPFRFFTPGSDEELRYHYNETDIFVSSCTYDAGSLPGLEAMRCGAALVTVYSGGNLAYCRHEDNCLMSYRYENRLAQDVERLIAEPALRRRLAEQGERDSYAWTWKASVAAFETAVIDMYNRSRLS